MFKFIIKVFINTGLWAIGAGWWLGSLTVRKIAESWEPRLPTGQRIIRHDDGYEEIELSHPRKKDPRYLENTQENRDRIAANTQRSPLRAFVNLFIRW